MNKLQAKQELNKAMLSKASSNPMGAWFGFLLL